MEPLPKYVLIIKKQTKKKRRKLLHTPNIWFRIFERSEYKYQELYLMVKVVSVFEPKAYVIRFGNAVDLLF